MGLEIEQFVHPERISSQLFCAICTQVLENPVVTETEHMYCENELLDWFVTKGDTICPMSNQKLDPSKIVKPGRIITNMLNELERYCLHRSEGCCWTGSGENVKLHCKSCPHRPREALDAQIEQQSSDIKKLKQRLSDTLARVDELEQENLHLKRTNEAQAKKLKVYDAFFANSDDCSDDHGVITRSLK